MKPIKLTMTAFGPYKNKEVIDFRELEDHRLFVISGNTGAGKTTIFDAICFALYGTASGEDRTDAKSLRSDFADDDVHTAVELEFELRNRHYRIKRQLPHVKKGNKTATGDEYEFYEIVDDTEIPCVDRQIVSEINKKVEELIGLTKDQFVQIVMLPQGEFRKFLTSETENKEEILRKIFKTDRYTFITQRLKDKKQTAEDSFKQEIATRDRYIADIQATLPYREDSDLFRLLNEETFNTYQVLDGLAEEMTYYKTALSDYEKQLNAIEAQYDKKLKDFHKAESINKEFEKLAEKEHELSQQLQQKPFMKEIEQQLEQAEKAAKIEPYEKQLNEWRREEQEKERRFKQATAEKQQAETQLKQAEEKYVQEKNKQGERDEVKKQHIYYLDLLPSVRNLTTEEKNLQDRYQSVQVIKKQLEQAQHNLSAQRKRKSELSEKIKKMEDCVEQFASMQQKLVDMKNEARLLQEYLVLNKKQQELIQKGKQIKAEYKTIKEHYEDVESRWINGQATILAAHLHDGKPCPVCGSQDHPNKANSQVPVPTKEELEFVKNKFTQIDSEYRNIAAEYRANNEQLEQKEQELVQNQIPIENAQYYYDELMEKGKSLRSKIAELEQEKNILTHQKQELDKLEQTLIALEESVEKLSHSYQTARTDYEASKAVYENQLKRIPEQLRTLTVLEKKIQENEQLSKQLEQQWETAQKDFQKAQELATNARVNYSHIKQQLDESRSKKANVEQQFLRALAQENFADENAFQEAKRSEKERNNMKQQLETYERQLQALQLQINDLKTRLQDKEKYNLEELEQELKAYKQIFEQKRELHTKTSQYLEYAENLAKKIKQADEQVAQYEKHLNIVTDLYDVIRGQNEQKISFERYLLIEYLEQIIVAANERLRSLSNGQFSLRRSDRQEARGKQSGLALDVYDSLSGQNRDVKTLSGGEKFNASLSLALGMSDVIQSHQGGVSIETMFIDEGFGSLDEEALTKAIDTLIDLQKSGRIVGVISHVQEMKNTIPAILEVEKTLDGSSKTKFVIK